MTPTSISINHNCIQVEQSASTNRCTHNLQPSPSRVLQRFAAHKVAPAIVNYTAGAMVFAGAALFLTGFGALPGIILASLGSALFLSCTALSVCNLPADIGTGDYIEFSGQCFVWGLCFVFTLPTIVLLKISIYFSVSWLLHDDKAGATDSPFCTDLSWLMAPPPWTDCRILWLSADWRWHDVTIIVACGQDEIIVQ